MSSLDGVCAILSVFGHEIDGIRAFYKQNAADNLNFEPVLPETWQEKYYRIWIHGATVVWEYKEEGASPVSLSPFHNLRAETLLSPEIL